MREKGKKYQLVKILLMSCLAFVFALQFAPETAEAATIQTEVSGTEHYGMAWEILDLVNAERAKESLPALTMHPSILNYAMLRAAECVVLFSHTRPDGTSALHAPTMPAGRRGENIAAWQTSAAAVVTSWMNSAGHKANIMDPGFVSIGIGVYQSGGRYYYTQLFSNASATAPPRSAAQTAKTHPVEIDVTAARVKVKAVATPNYALNLGDTKPVNLPKIYLEIYDAALLTPWAQVEVDATDLAYTIDNSSIATIAGANLKTANLQAVGVGNTTLDIFVAGAPSKAVTFGITVAPSTHTHTHTPTVVAPTCILAGYTEHVCSGCTESYRDTITAATGHSYTVTATVPATCTVAGHIEHTCSDCSHSYQDPIARLSHTYVSAIIAPTCTIDGYTEHTCSDCGDVQRDTIVSAPGHDYVVINVVPASTPCMPDGYTEYECNDCGDIYQESITPANHTYVSTVMPATCTTDGYTEHVCSVCGHTHQDTVVPAAHVYVSVVVSATCTTDGYTEHDCSVCGHTHQDNIVSATHDYQDTVTLAATCTVEGIMEHKCTVCGDRAPDTVIAARGHVFGAWNVVSEDGRTQIEERVCATDGTVERRQVEKESTSPSGTHTGSGANNTNKTNTGANAGGKAPKTGDSTVAMPFVIGGMSAILVIGLVLVRAMHRKNNPHTYK